MHRNRVRKENLADKRHLLRIPLVIADIDGLFMLTNPEEATNPTENASLCLPSFRPRKLSRNIRFAKLVRNRMRSHVFRGFDDFAPQNEIMPLGVYKDYSGDTDDTITSITQLPAYIDLGVPHSDLDIYPNFTKKRGAVQWCSPTEAIEELDSALLSNPNNPKSIDSKAMLELIVNYETRLEARHVRIAA